MCNYEQLLKRLSDKPWPSTSRQRGQRLGFVGEKERGWEGGERGRGDSKAFCHWATKKKKKLVFPATGLADTNQPHAGELFT